MLVTWYFLYLMIAGNNKVIPEAIIATPQKETCEFWAQRIAADYTSSEGPVVARCIPGQITPPAPS